MPLNSFDIAILDHITQVLAKDLFKVSASVHNDTATFSLRSIKPIDEVCISTLETEVQLGLGDPLVKQKYPDMQISFTNYSIYLDGKQVA